MHSAFRIARIDQRALAIGQQLHAVERTVQTGAKNLLALFGLWLLPVAGFASGMDPFCKFSTSTSGSISSARYRIADAFQKADLVVVGTGIENPENGKPQDLEVSVVVKGSNKGDRRLKLV